MQNYLCYKDSVSNVPVEFVAQRNCPAYPHWSNVRWHYSGAERTVSNSADANVARSPASHTLSCELTSAAVLKGGKWTKATVLIQSNFCFKISRQYSVLQCRNAPASLEMRIGYPSSSKGLCKRCATIVALTADGPVVLIGPWLVCLDYSSDYCVYFERQFQY